MSTESPNFILDEKMFIDEKPGSYYRNKFLNNCKSRMRECDKIYIHLQSLKNKLELIYEYEAKKYDTQLNSMDILDCVSKNIESAIESVEQYKSLVNEQYIECGSVDYDQIINGNREIISEKIKQDRKNHEIQNNNVNSI